MSLDKNIEESFLYMERNSEIAEDRYERMWNKIVSLKKTLKKTLKKPYLISSRFLKASALIVLVLTAVSFVFIPDNGTDTGFIMINQANEKHSKDSAYQIFIESDILISNSVKEIAAKSEYIVYGEVVKRSSRTRNLERNPLNPKEESIDTKTMSQEYEFKVSKWLKGSGEDKIDIVYEDYMLHKDGTKIITDYHELPLVAGQKYVLFLFKNHEDEGLGYLGSAEPWQFKFDGNKFIPISSVGGTPIKPVTLEEIIKEINDAKRK